MRLSSWQNMLHSSIIQVTFIGMKTTSALDEFFGSLLKNMSKSSTKFKILQCNLYKTMVALHTSYYRNNTSLVGQTYGARLLLYLSVAIQTLILL